MGSKIRNSMPMGKSNARKRLQPTEQRAEASRNADLIWCRPVGQKQLRVLVVDDDPDTANSLCSMVQAWGHGIWNADDGAAALEMASVFQVDVVLLDIAMPAMDGCQVIRRLRRQSGFEDTLLIGLLDPADREQRGRAENAGVDLCLIKPVEPSTLEALLLLEQAFLASAPAARPATPRKICPRVSVVLGTTSGG